MTRLQSKICKSAALCDVLDPGYGPQHGLWPEVDGVPKVDASLLSRGHRG